MKDLLFVLILFIVCFWLFLATKKHTSIKEVYVCDGKNYETVVEFSTHINPDTCGWVDAKVTENLFFKKIYVY